MKLIASFFLTAFFFIHAYANAQQANPMSTETLIDGYVVRHVIFNSTFVLPEVAQQYGLKRSEYESLLNISVNRQGEFGGEEVKLEGTYKNLMQQQKVLQFQQIKEKDAIYYLAPVRISGEEMLHFSLQIQTKDKTFETSFSQKVYSD
ncbi:hypothetical protein TDB9533_03860 [Thalassocella blandensis]|nr:hypothetical protein TDB9533_03860 [Thalassocella blandensis]